MAIFTDPIREHADFGPGDAEWLHLAAPIAGAVLTVLIAVAITRMKNRRQREKLDLIS